MFIHLEPQQYVRPDKPPVVSRHDIAKDAYLKRRCGTLEREAKEVQQQRYERGFMPIGDAIALCLDALARALQGMAGRLRSRST